MATQARSLGDRDSGNIAVTWRLIPIVKYLYLPVVATRPLWTSHSRIEPGSETKACSRRCLPTVRKQVARQGVRAAAVCARPVIPVGSHVAWGFACSRQGTSCPAARTVAATGAWGSVAREGSQASKLLDKTQNACPRVNPRHGRRLAGGLTATQHAVPRSPQPGRTSRSNQTAN